MNNQEKINLNSIYGKINFVNVNYKGREYKCRCLSDDIIAYIELFNEYEKRYFKELNFVNNKKLNVEDCLECIENLYLIKYTLLFIIDKYVDCSKLVKLVSVNIEYLKSLILNKG